jgi:hypothetical protein
MDLKGELIIFDSSLINKPRTKNIVQIMPQHSTYKTHSLLTHSIVKKHHDELNKTQHDEIQYNDTPNCTEHYYELRTYSFS